MFNFAKKYICKNENLYKTIVEATGSSLDLNKTIKTIIDIVGKVLNSDRCFIMEYDKQKDRFSESQEEYLSSPNLRSYIGVDLNEHIPHLVSEFKKGKRLIFNVSNFQIDNENIDLQDSSFEKEKIAVEEYKIHSALVFPLYVVDEFLGDLVIHYVYKKHKVGEEEINLLATVANQIAIALHQSKLYQKTLEQANREHLLRKITKTIRETLDINETKKTIVTESYKTLKADRVFIVEFNPETNVPKVLDEYSECISANLESLIGYDFASSEVEFLANIYRQKQPVIMPNIEEFVIENNLQNADVEKWIRMIGAKTGIGIPMVYGNKIFGVLCVIYTTSLHPITDEYIDFIKTISEQAGIALHQAELYQKTIKQAEREKGLRQITNKIRSTLDIEKILSYICEEIAKLFNVQRVSIPAYPDQNNYEKYIIKYEYVASPNIKTYPNAGDALKTADYWGQILTKSQEVIAFDNIKDSDAPAYFKNTYKDLRVMANMGVAIRKGGDIWGCIVLSELRNSRHWSDEEKTLLKTIADQVYIAINQAELHAITKLQAEREVLLRKITFTIRTSLNLEETFSIICSEIAKITGANRVAIVEIIEKYNQDKIRGEFKTSEFIKGLKDTNIERTVVFEYLTTYVFSKNEPLIINNIEESDAPEFVKDFYRDLDVKSVTVFPVKKGEDEWGILTISYINEYKYWSESETNFLVTIIEQIYIAIKQAELYENEKQALEREALLRNITETIRSSIDIDKIKYEIVTKIGKAFGADRCYIRTYDISNTNSVIKSLNLFSEYRLSPDVKSLIDYSIEDEAKEYLINHFQKKKPFILPDVEKFIKEENLEGKPAANFFIDNDIKSGLAIPIVYDDELIGAFAIHYTNRTKKYSVEEIQFATSIAGQIAIAMYQSSLYNTVKQALEREKISKNIIEILRSSIDKTIIKKLFVKNIGKFFEAGRVLLSEYDAEEKRYLPADKDSEYLSTPQQQSLVDYDWTRPEVSEFIQPLLDKRELNIFSWDEYIQQNQKGQDFINFFESYNIKSSYNFPIVYQQNIMGFFCIDFINEARKLSDEDIIRLRNMSTQAGIALYHAKLYEKAQECFHSRASYISEISEQIKKPTNEILDTSILLSKSEFERTAQIEYLNTIINACHQLLELTKDDSQY